MITLVSWRDIRHDKPWYAMGGWHDKCRRQMSRRCHEAPSISTWSIMFAIFPACAAWDASEVWQHEVLQDERQKTKKTWCSLWGCIRKIWKNLSIVWRFTWVNVFVNRSCCQTFKWWKNRKNINKNGSVTDPTTPGSMVDIKCWQYLAGGVKKYEVTKCSKT